MKIASCLLALVATLGLAACADEQATTYPLSGQQCTGDDPVMGLDPVNCAPVGTL